MTFQPILPISGYAGWRFLQRTLPTQQESFVKSPAIQRATDYFKENIGKITNADALVADRRLMEVALGAFGLGEDINAKAFVARVLSDGTQSDEALANRLSDKRYAEFSEAFGFGNGFPKTGLSGFTDRIIAKYEAREFEVAVGAQDEDMRLALGLSEGLATVLDRQTGPDARWFAVMGNPPLRKLVEGALGLPTAIAQIDIEQQLDQFKSRAEAIFGTSDLSELAAPENQDKMIRLYMAKAQLASGGSTTGGTIALSLLQSMPRPYGAQP
ncbi:DUF1217 domain-containing protein [Loktanella sp. IMCC34160]|uniref:DUF1217 domain-containing protein n=1 Tax=Loktanella sp. IMCC34160 TaxID=2510646 RepID=UPI00101DA3DF|nr:DUF1217 domain-containing protein [Loktanella sp. IMCC34160]RYG91477.1 DUF1217 domain-containing protein [Loktanella sp. IMCC34160]